jgi:soluble lytic murein transglycosylase-like protein
LPRVPVYEGPSVRPTPLRVSQDIRAPEAAFGGATAQAVSQAGQQFGQVASLLDRRAEEHGKEDAELAAWNAYTAASAEQQKLFYQGDNAIYNRRGGNAMGAANEAAVELKRIGDETGKGLTSPYAQQQFQKLWSRNQESEMGAVSRHEAGQRREFADQTVAGALANSQNMATLRYNDAKEVDDQIGIGELAIRANTKGLPPEQVNAQVTAFRSSVHKAVTLRMATDNPLAANEYYKSHADDFTADDNVSLQRTLEPTVKRATARVEADKVINEITTGKASLPTTITTAQEQIESGGKQTAVSSAGNYGVMQINDVSGKEAADALSVPWDPAKARTDAGYNRQLGQKYMQIQLDKYNGNTALALAAYNAGPGRVDEWIKAYGDPRTGDITDAAWAAKLPVKETRDYIAKVGSAITKGVQSNIDLTKAGEITKDRFKDDPEMQDAVDARIAHENAIRESARRDRETEAYLAGLKHIDAGGSVDNLPPDVIENLAPTRRSDLEAHERAKTKRKDPPDNPAEFNRLMTLSVTDPDSFIAEDVTAWAKVLPNAQVDQLIGLKAARMTKEAKEEGKANDVRKAISLTSNLLRSAKIDPTPKDNDKTGAEVMNAYTAKLMERLDQFKQKEGRRATDSEVMEMGRELLLPGRLSVNWWPDKDVKAFQVTPDTASQFYVPIDKIPPNEKADITAALGTRVTNELVEQIYGAVKRGDKAMVQRLMGSKVPNPVN